LCICWGGIPADAKQDEINAMSRKSAVRVTPERMMLRNTLQKIVNTASGRVLIATPYHIEACLTISNSARFGWESWSTMENAGNSLPPGSEINGVHRKFKVLKTDVQVGRGGGVVDADDGPGDVEAVAGGVTVGRGGPV
jgi:hypothetical protein